MSDQPETIDEVVAHEKKLLRDAKYRTSHRAILRLRCKEYRSKHRRVRNEQSRMYHKNNPLRNIFYLMRQRCGINKGAHEYQLNWYANRGITISQDWDTYDKFEEWALSHGWKKGLQIDRIDNNGDYSPQNCRFVTPKENSRNRRNTRWVVFCGERISLAELAERTGVDRRKITYRLNKGMTAEEAIK